jgi:hypothetical protein
MFLKWHTDKQLLREKRRTENDISQAERERLRAQKLGFNLTMKLNDIEAEIKRRDDLRKAVE